MIEFDRRFLLDLSEYQRDNLLWLLDVAQRLGLDTGDWHHEVRSQLRPDLGVGLPNRPRPVTDVDSRAREAVDLWFFQRPTER